MSSFVPIPIPDSAPPIYAVKVDDNRIGATLRSLCDVLDLARHAQAARIKRDPALAKALVTVLLDSPGGFQKTEVLLSGAIPVWLSGLNISRLPGDKQALALYVQQNAVDLIEQALSNPENNVPQPPSSQPTIPQSVWDEGYTFIDHLKAAYDKDHNRMAVIEYNLHGQALRLAALEARQISQSGGLSGERLEYIYKRAHEAHLRYGYALDETLAGLAAHFGVKNIYYLPDKDWPAVLTWFEGLLED